MPYFEPVSLHEAAKIIMDFFGDRVTVYSANSETQDISFVLYDAIPVRAGVDPHHGSLSLVFPLAERVLMSSPLKRSTTLCRGEAQIREALQAIDDYCRLRLPDKYLEAFDAAIFRSSALDKPSKSDE